MNKKLLFNMVGMFAITTSLCLAAKPRSYEPLPNSQVDNILFSEVTEIAKDPQSNEIPAHQVKGNLTYDYKMSRKNNPYFMVYENEAAKNDASPHLTVFPNMNRSHKTWPHVTINAQDRNSGYRLYFHPSEGVNVDETVISSYGTPAEEYRLSNEGVQNTATNIISQVQHDWDMKESNDASAQDGYQYSYAI